MGELLRLMGEKKRWGRGKKIFFSHNGLNLATLVFKKHEYSCMCTHTYIYIKYIYAQTHIYINIYNISGM